MLLLGAQLIEILKNQYLKGYIAKSRAILEKHYGLYKSIMDIFLDQINKFKFKKISNRA